MLNLDSIYKEYASFIYKYLYSLCHDEHLAEELTQETFYQAVKSAKKYDNSCKVSTWLCQIAKNTYSSLATRQKNAPYVDVTEGSGDPEEALLASDSAFAIHRILHDLKEPYKEVFTLRVYGQLPFSQIGQLFGKSDSWARLIYYRAKQEIRRNLHEDEL